MSAIAALKGRRRFSTEQGLALVALVALAACVGMACYVLFYRLNDASLFWNGFIPLIVDAGVVGAFLVVLALS